VTPSSRLSLLTGVVYTSTQPSRVPYTPRWTAVGGLTFSASRLRAALDAQWLGERVATNLRFPGGLPTVDGFFLLNARLGWRFGKGARAGELFVAGENLTGAEYAYRPDYPMPGLSVMVGLKWGL
jgi:iron complex outermembrane receptor protein